MSLKREKNGVWTVSLDELDEELLNSSHSFYFEALPRYLTAMDSIFERAKETSDFNFLWSIFAVRGAQDPGWDPYETTVRTIGCVRERATVH